MKKVVKSFGRRFAAVALSATLCASTVCGALVFATSAAWAQTAPLTIRQMTDLNASLTTAIDAAKCDQDLIRKAIARILSSAINQLGSGQAAWITAAILLQSEQYGRCVSAADIGSGMALAAISFSPTDRATASVIALQIANEGTQPEIQAFQTTANQLGYAYLASIAATTPTATGALDSVFSSSNPNGFFGTGQNPTAGCLNPTCTKL